MPKLAKKWVGEITITNESVTWDFPGEFQPYYIRGQPKRPHPYFQGYWPPEVEIRWTRGGPLVGCTHTGVHTISQSHDGDYGIDHNCIPYNFDVLLPK
jgi:hypothetical protein